GPGLKWGHVHVSFDCDKSKVTRFEDTFARSQCFGQWWCERRSFYRPGVVGWEIDPREIKRDKRNKEAGGWPRPGRAASSALTRCARPWAVVGPWEADRSSCSPRRFETRLVPFADRPRSSARRTPLRSSGIATSRPATWWSRSARAPGR